MVYGSGLENQRVFTGTVGSNPTLSVLKPARLHQNGPISKLHGATDQTQVHGHGESDDHRVSASITT